MESRPLESYDRHFEGALRYRHIQLLIARREKLAAKARNLDLTHPGQSAYFERELVPVIDEIDFKLDQLIGPESEAESQLEKDAVSFHKLTEWDMKRERAIQSLKGAFGGLGISALGAALTGLTYLMAEPGESYLVFTGLMLVGLIGVGYSLLHWIPLLIRHVYLILRKRQALR